MKIYMRNVTNDYKDEAKPYYEILNDFKNNFFQAYISNIEFYGYHSEKFLKMIKESIPKYHKEFNEIIDNLMTAINKEDVKGALVILIKRLKKASNFDWSDFKKLEKFFRVYDKIIKRLNKLP